MRGGSWFECLQPLQTQRVVNQDGKRRELPSRTSSGPFRIVPTSVTIIKTLDRHLHQGRVRIGWQHESGVCHHLRALSVRNTWCPWGKGSMALVGTPSPRTPFAVFLQDVQPEEGPLTILSSGPGFQAQMLFCSEVQFCSVRFLSETLPSVCTDALPSGW